jgi:hypothetical protein
MFELLKTIGSFVGLLTGAFTVYDRVAKGRPVATLTFSKVGDGISPKVAIFNASDTTIVILGWSIIPDVYFLIKDDSLRSSIEDQLKTFSPFSLNPRQSVEFTFVPRYKGGVNMDSDDQAVRFSFRWCRANATWLPQFPMTIWTHTPLLRKLYGTE